MSIMSSGLLTGYLIYLSNIHTHVAEYDCPVAPRTKNAKSVSRPTSAEIFANYVLILPITTTPHNHPRLTPGSHNHPTLTPGTYNHPTLMPGTYNHSTLIASHTRPLPHSRQALTTIHLSPLPTARIPELTLAHTIGLYVGVSVLVLSLMGTCMLLMIVVITRRFRKRGKLVILQ